MVCGDVVPIARCMPTTPMNVNGATIGWPSRVNVTPAGVDVSVTCPVLGLESRNVVADAPAESVTVRWMRYQTFDDVSPIAGMKNDPLVAPDVGGTDGCVWVSWWKMTSQVNREAARLPSSASV